MFIIVPFIAFFLFWFGFYQQTRQGRQSFLFAAALWGSIVWFLTELLSLAHALSYAPLVFGWSMVLIGAAWWAVSYKVFFCIDFFIRPFRNFTLTEKFILFLIITIAVLKGLSAIYSAPNTSDAMTYHLNRVEHWVQNHSVSNYPSHVTRQLYSPPWAEYAILHLRILSQGDYFSNAVQWFSAVGSWVSVAGLAQLMGARRHGQLLAVLLAACLPMGLVQATSTQTDYVMTFWTAGFVYLLWALSQQRTWGLSLAAGSFLGLALLTKGNAYVFTPVWLVVFLLASIISRDWRRLKFLALILALALMINLPYAIRNTGTFGKPFWTHASFINQNISPSQIMSNMQSNLALHLGQSTGEDDTGNEMYLVLMLGVLLWTFLYRPLEHRACLIFGLCTVLMFVIFSAVIVYDPFNSRFHLAIFIISTALAGTVLAGWLPHQIDGGSSHFNLRKFMALAV